jgi:hypothetical protein
LKVEMREVAEVQTEASIVRYAVESFLAVRVVVGPAAWVFREREGWAARLSSSCAAWFLGARRLQIHSTATPRNPVFSSEVTA